MAENAETEDANWVSGRSNSFIILKKPGNSSRGKGLHKTVSEDTARCQGKSVSHCNGRDKQCQ